MYVVKYKTAENMITHVLYVLGILLILLDTILCSSSWAHTLRVGGDEYKTRIVYPLQNYLEPLITTKDQTLIVKFPNIIAEPTYVQDFQLIQDLNFDGQSTRITINTPFRYRVKHLDTPPCLVIDIFSSKTPAAACPFDKIHVIPKQNGVSMIFSMTPGVRPKVLTTKNLIYFIFDSNVSCDEINCFAKSLPYLELKGILHMHNGCALVLSCAREDIDLMVHSDEFGRSVLLELSTTNPENQAIHEIADSNQENLTSIIDLLEPKKDKLDPYESIMLSRAYWQLYYPYGESSKAKEALEIIAHNLESLPSSKDKEDCMLEYSWMLIRQNMLSDATKYIRFLKESLYEDITIMARIQEIDVLNGQHKFDDAFVADKRLRNNFDIEQLISRQKSYYLTTTGDTYFGLNAFSKALELYKDALENDSLYNNREPSIYSRLAEAALCLENYDEAKTYICQAINLGNPENKARHLVQLGDCLYQLGDIEKAINVFAKAENISPDSENSAVAQLRTAKILLENDISEDGILSDKTFFEIMDIYTNIHISPLDMEGSLESIVTIRMAQAFAKHKDWDDALQAYYKVWVSLPGDDPMHAYALSDALYTITDWVKSLYSLADHTRISQLYNQYRDSFLADINLLEDPDVLFILAHALYHTGDPVSARPLFVSCANSISSYKPDAICALFDVDYASGELAQAYHWNTLYLEEYPQRSDAARIKEQRGELLYRLGRYKQAVIFLKSYFSQDNKEELKRLYLLAQSYFKLTNKGNEGMVLDRIITFNNQINSPFIENALYIRANQLKDGGDLARAKTLYDILLKTYPDSRYTWWSRYHVAVISHRIGNISEAQKILDEIIRTTDDALLISAAQITRSEIELEPAILEFNDLKNRFGRN